MLSFASTVVLSLAAFAGFASAVPAGKPVGGPAQATMTIYSGPYSCVDAFTAPPTDGSAGTAQTISLVQDGCTIINLPTAGVFTSSLTVAPKTGTAGCYAQLFNEAGCGVTLSNQYHGFPYDGVSIGNKVNCAKPPLTNYGAVRLVCV